MTTEDSKRETTPKTLGTTPKKSATTVKRYNEKHRSLQDERRKRQRLYFESEKFGDAGCS